MDRKLPQGVAPYARTPLFTTQTVPDSLTSKHETKDGTYGRLVVERGEVSYFLEGEAQPMAKITPDAAFIIFPQETHYVQLAEDTAFYVEFCREEKA